MDYFSLPDYERHVLELKNAHKSTQNLSRSPDIAMFYSQVNHLVSLLVQAGGFKKVILDGKFIDISELRRSLKWNGFLIRKFGSEKRSYYYIQRRDGVIMLGRTSSLIRDYNNRFRMLLRISSLAIKVSEDLSTTLKDKISEENPE